MVDKQHFHFYSFVMSGLAAVIVYLSLIFTLFFYNFSIFKTKYIPKRATTLEQIISVNLESISDEEQTSTGGMPLDGLGIKDIFFQIPDSNIPAEPIQGDNRSNVAKNSKEKAHQNQHHIQSIQDELRKLNSDLQAIKGQTLEIKTDVIASELADGEYNEWFAKIYDIIYKNWKPNFYQDAKVTALLQIDNSGHFSFYVTKLSQYDDYNQNVSNYLESLKNQDLPSYSRGKRISVEVNFIVNKGDK